MTTTVTRHVPAVGAWLAATSVASTGTIWAIFTAGGTAGYAAVAAIGAASVGFVAATQAATRRPSDEPRLDAVGELAAANPHLVRGPDRIGLHR